MPKAEGGLRSEEEAPVDRAGAVQGGGRRAVLQGAGLQHLAHLAPIAEAVAESVLQGCRV